MHTNEKIWFEQHRRWMRPDAHLRVKADAQKWLPAGVSHPALPLPDQRKSAPTSSTETGAMNEVQESGITEADWLELRAMISDLKLDFRLACLRRKYSPDQPRVPAGNSDGGQWTSGGGGGAQVVRPGAARPVPPRTRLAAATDPTVMSDAAPPGIPVVQSAENVTGRPGSRSAATPVDVVLPDGSKVPDKDSPTGYMRSPVADLSDVAQGGRQTGLVYRTLKDSPYTFPAGATVLGVSMYRDLHHGGTFDYQRELNDTGEYTQLPQYRHVSNFNVGLYSQQAGLSLNETLVITGIYTRLWSNNADPTQPYWLPLENRRFMELGFRAGERGGFR